MESQFSYLSKPSAYVIQTDRRAYMVVKGKPLKDSHKRSSCSHHHHVSSKRSQHKDQRTHQERDNNIYTRQNFKPKNTNRLSARQRKMPEIYEEQKISFHNHGLEPNCHYNEQIEDENECLKAENKCLQHYIRVLEDRLTGIQKPGLKRTVFHETDRNRLNIQQEQRKSESNKLLFSTKGTASWI